jgi:hypothetical protein
MPTKSAVHEALQRRAGERPGASFSVKSTPRRKLGFHLIVSDRVVRSRYVTTCR